MELMEGKDETIKLEATATASAGWTLSCAAVPFVFSKSWFSEFKAKEFKDELSSILECLRQAGDALLKNIGGVTFSTVYY